MQKIKNAMQWIAAGVLFVGYVAVSPVLALLQYRLMRKIVW